MNPVISSVITAIHPTAAPAPRRARGFTMVEIMVSMALLSVILGAAMGAFISVNTSTQQVVITSDLQDNARSALEVLASDLRSAGVGASNGTVGIAPGGTGSWSARIPTIYSGPAQTFKDPSGNTYTLNSVYIIGVDTSSLGISGAGDGIQAVITGPSDNKVRCTTAAGTAVDCKNSSIGSDLVEHAVFIPTTGGAFQPLLVHDNQRASYISPTNLTGAVGTQILTFAEQGSGGISPDPSAPFGFAQGFQLSRARVVHWYMKQTFPAAPRLYRSHPTLTPASGSCATAFIDETNSGSGVVGAEIAAGPIESLQIRFVFDPDQFDDPTAYKVVSSIDPCDATAVTLMRTLREVRVQMVAISARQAQSTNANTATARYLTPAFEGAGGGAAADTYPRRSYTTRVAPRNVQPYRL